MHVCLFYAAIICPNLEAPENGSIVSMNNNFRQHTVFSCDDGFGFIAGAFTHAGNIIYRSRLCQGTDRSSIGYWTEVQPACARMGNTI